MSITNKPDPTVVSLFAGCGGSSLGYKQAGFDVRLAVEWDTGAANVYRRNFPGANVFEGDIADLTAEEALKAATLEPGELDVLDGSPPCQGFSTSGHRKFSDSRNRLFEEYIRMLEAFRPKMLVMENVSGLRKGKMKLIFAEMTRALKDAGYKISCRELNAWWYGVPQRRTRLIWVGVRQDLEWSPSHPNPTQHSPLMPATALDYSIAWYEVAGFAKGLPPRSIRKRDGTKSLFPTLAAQAFGGIRRSKSSIDREGRQPGPLTIAEAKTLQGFPEWFEMYENEYKFLGNSVCPPMAEAIGRHLAALLGEA
jgi:DNA (cytosine-5)-methyltransferase 1